MNWNTEKLLKRLRSRKNPPTDNEIIFYLSSIDTYQELGYIGHILGGKRMLLKKKGKDYNVFVEPLQVIQCKREMLRDDKLLSSIYDKHLYWHDDEHKGTCLTFGDTFWFNDDVDYQKSLKK